MPASLKTVRVFISSTFRDMHAERDHLVTVVFPELRERVELLGLEFFDVDLRWGVPAKDANGETANSWEYCRQWIDRVEPFFVSILGQRYGHRPDPRELRDPAEQSRQLEQRRSITELEVRHAVLSDRRKRRSYFYLRDTPVPVLSTAATTEERAAYQEFVDLPEQLVQLEALKADIRRCGRPVRGYTCRWTGKEFADLDKAKKKFGPMVLEDLWSGVLRDERYVSKEVWRQVLGADPDTDPRYTDESQPVPRELWEKIVALAKPQPKEPLDAEREQMEAFAAARLRWFQGRTDELGKLTAFVRSTEENAPRLAVVAAVPGQGKSALLAKLSTLISEPSTFLITHFVGATERSASAHALVKRLLDELDLSGITWPTEDQKEGQEPKRDFNSLCLRLAQRLDDYADERRIVILLDALNQLSDGHDLQWLPSRLGPGVRVIVSCVEDAAAKADSLEQRVLHALASRQPAPLRVPLGPLTEADVRTIVVAYLKEYCHELDREHLDTLCEIKQARNPLYLLVMLNELRTLGGNNLNRIVPALIASMPLDHPDTVSLFRWVLQRLEVFGPEAVQWWCLYLAHGRIGMASRELSDLLARKLGADATATALRIERGLRRYLQRRGPQLDFFHSQLRQAVIDQYGPHAQVDDVDSDIATYFRGLADPEGTKSWKSGNPRPFLELAFHLAGAQRLDELCETLRDIRFVDARCRHSQVYELIDEYAFAAKRLDGANLALMSPMPTKHLAQEKGTLAVFEQAIGREADTLAKYPHLAWQQICNRLRFVAGPARQIVEAETIRRSAEGGSAWIALRAPLHESTGLLTTLQAHDSVVWNCAVSPDGRIFASAGKDGAVRIWAADNSKEICTVRHDELADAQNMDRLRSRLPEQSLWTDNVIAVIRRGANQVVACAFDQSGTLLAAMLGSETLVVWDARNGNERWRSSNFNNFIERTEIDTSGVIRMFSSYVSMVVDTEGNVIFAPRGNDLGAWDLRDGTALGTWPIRPAGIAIQSAYGTAVVAEQDPPGRVFALNPRTGSNAMLFHGGEEGLRSCAFVPRPMIIVTGSAKGQITVRNGRTGDIISTRNAHERGVMFCSAAPDGRHLITADYESLKVWKFPELAEHESLRGLQVPAAFSPDSKFLVSSTSQRRNELTVWELATGAKIVRLVGHSSMVRCCAYTSDGTRIISGGDDGTLRVWDARHRDDPAESPFAHFDFLRSCAFSADGRTLVTADDSGSIQIWDADTLNRKSKFHADVLTKCAIGPDGSTLVSAGRGVVKLWDATDGRELASLATPDLQYLLRAECAISPDGKSAAIRHDEGIKIWNLKTFVATAVVDKFLAQGCCFTPDARWLLTGEISGVSVRSVDTGIRRGMTLDPGYWTNHLSCFAVSPAGDFVVTGDSEGRLRIWDWPPDSMTGGGNFVNLLPALELRANTSDVYRCAVGVGGRIIAAAGEDGMVRIWDARDGTALGSLPVSGVSCVALHPLRPLLVLGMSSGDVHFADLRHMPSGTRSDTPAPPHSNFPIYGGAQSIRAVPQAPPFDPHVWLERMSSIEGGWRIIPQNGPIERISVTSRADAPLTRLAPSTSQVATQAAVPPGPAPASSPDIGNFTTCAPTTKPTELRGDAIASVSNMLAAIDASGTSALPVGFAEIPSPHPRADGNRAAQLNMEYQKARRAWEALPWWKRIRTPRPEPPTGM
jgi:WD40 repeat protein